MSEITIASLRGYILRYKRYRNSFPVMLIINPATWEQLVYEEQSNKTGVQIIATIPPRFMGIKVLRSLDVKENDLYYVGEGAEVNLAQFGI